MSETIVFIERRRGLGKEWRQSLKGERLIGFLAITLLCKEHNQIERFRIPVLQDARRTVKNQRTVGRVHYVKPGRFKVYNWCTVNVRCLDRGPKELVDAMYRELRPLTLGFGTLSVAFVRQDRKIVYSVERED